MQNHPLTFHYDENVTLPTNSLAEAWLELQWELEQTPIPNLKRDPNFDIALGAFYRNIKERYVRRKNLDAAQVPQDMTPHIVRYQFQQGDEELPVLQLGPGIASVNFTKGYTWDAFKAEALFLREQLMQAYDQELTPKVFILRYRNLLPFLYTSNNLVDYLRDNLNITMKWPEYIPGDAGKSTAPATFNFSTSFILKNNLGVGKVTIGTGIHSTPNRNKPDAGATEILIVDLEVGSKENNPPSLVNAVEFEAWLINVHRVIHDWYLALIDGVLFQQFKGE